ncbi:hypothetical protein RR48_06684 [Papilio machaon]|uniref:Uncharacterized protein n=1 Tax=Papilio machaon TaxID=76193 RepID=A0A194R4V7_PAPMA|nr:hypothetical protein RR48_06684 [Papilio machaon]
MLRIASSIELTSDWVSRMAGLMSTDMNLNETNIKDKGWSLSPAWEPVLLRPKQKNNEDGVEYVSDIVSTFCAPFNVNNNSDSSILNSSTSPSPTHATATAPPAPAAPSSRALRAMARSARRDATAKSSN